MKSNYFSPRWLVNQSTKKKKNIPKGPWLSPSNVDKVSRRLGQEDEGGGDIITNQNSDFCFGVMHVGPHKTNKNELTTHLSNSARRCYQFVEKSKFNQILEVLLSIVLVNFLVCRLTHLPLALAVFGNEDERHQSSRDYRSSQYPVPFGSENDERSFLRFADEDSYFRQAHSIAGSAFGYNGLQVQHNLDDNLLRSQNFKISPKPCSVGRIEGTCMFVWECIKSEGRHVGMCVDSFMFGSCCAHNYTDNIVLHNTFSYTRPTKPLGMGSMNHRPRPPAHPHRPSISGMTTIERPHGAGTLVIRPSGPHHQGPLFKPQHLKPAHGSNYGSSSSTTSTTTTTTTTSTTDDPTLLWTSNTVLGDLESSASISSATTVNHQQHHWHFTTEPNFITKPRPPGWDKPATLRPKPPKPSKKPSTTLDWITHHQQQQSHVTTSHISPSFSPYATRKPTKSPATAVTSSYSTYRPSSTTTGKTTTSTSATTTIITSPPPPPTFSHHTKPQSFVQNSKPTSSYWQPSTTRPYTKPSTSTSTSTTSTPTTTSLGPSSIAAASSVFASTSKPSSSWSHTKKPTTTTISTTGVLPTKTTTKRPTTATSSIRPSSSSSSSSSSTSTSSTTTTSSLASSSSSSSLLSSSSLSPTTLSNLSSIESNEISDNLDGPSATIKTISAARSECGVPVLTRPETRIVGGKSAAFGRWPWQVSVRRTSFFGFSSTHRCGGALINENWIATAGHCVDDLLITQIRIRVGEYDFSHVQEQLPYIERGVAKKVVHPQYNFFTYEYDLALVKLEQPLEFAPHVSPICLPQTNSLLIGMNATVTGWGRLSEGGTLPSVLQEVSVPIVSNDNCKSMFLRAGRQEFIPEIFLCAGYETGGQDSCQGDSGGPLQVKSQDGRYFLAGIISWGIGCAEANLPGVCTRISKFVPWIMENVT